MSPLSNPPSSKAARALACVVAFALACAVAFSGADVRADTARNALSFSPLEEVLQYTRTDLWIESLTLAQGLTLQLSQRLSHVRRDLASPVFRTVAQQFTSRALSVRFREFMAARASE